MEDIILINPETNLNIENNEPLNLLSLAAYLKHNGISASIYDEIKPLYDIKERIRKVKYVGITSNTCSYPRAVKVASEVKKINPKIITIGGGVHPTTMPEKAIDDGFDIVVVGEGERALLEILSKNIQNGIYQAEPITEHELYRPDRTLIDMDFYSRTKERCPHDPNLNFIPYGIRMACYMTSRGCPYQCIFCHNIWRKTKIRFVPIEWVIEEILYLKDTYNVSALWLMDDHIFINRQRSISLFKTFIENKLNIIWASAVRADSIDEELIELAYDSGCRRLAIGVESGSQNILNILAKGTTVEQNLRAVNICRKYGIRTLTTIMIGNPNETMDDIKSTMEFILKCKTDDLAISILTPFPGTKLWKWCEENGRIPKEINFSEFNYLKAPIRITDFISPARLQSLKRNMLIRYYCQPHQIIPFVKKIIRNPASMYYKIKEYF